MHSATEAQKIIAGEFERASEAAAFIASRTSLRPQIALVLGSGLGAFADQFADAVRIPYTDIPHFPTPTAEGHAGKLVIGNAAGVAVVAMQGRVHFYEGLTMQQVTFPMRVFGRLGVRAAVLTNAAGGINTAYKQGCLVVLSDHLNLQGSSPLIGPNDARFGPRFCDMTEAYYKPYRELALAHGRRLGIDIYEGVYAAMFGPSYETPAEIRMLRTLGADLVGMSTVGETLVARHMGIRVLAISCVTNPAAGMGKCLSHDEVLETTERVKGQFIALLQAVLPDLADKGT